MNEDISTYQLPQGGPVSPSTGAMRALRCTNIRVRNKGTHQFRAISRYLIVSETVPSSDKRPFPNFGTQEQSVKVLVLWQEMLALTFGAQHKVAQPRALSTVLSLADNPLSISTSQYIRFDRIRSGNAIEGPKRAHVIHPCRQTLINRITYDTIW